LLGVVFHCLLLLLLLSFLDCSTCLVSGRWSDGTKWMFTVWLCFAHQNNHPTMCHLHAYWLHTVIETAVHSDGMFQRFIVNSSNSVLHIKASSLNLHSPCRLVLCSRELSMMSSWWKSTLIFLPACYGRNWLSILQSDRTSSDGTESNKSGHMTLSKLSSKLRVKMVNRCTR